MELSSIDLNKLHTFFSVAEHGGVTAAARRLALTPSAVSQSLSGFEASLDVRLFNRVGRRLVLTREGEMLHRRFRDYHHRLQEAVTEIANEEREVRGPIRVGLFVGFPRAPLARFVTDFTRAHPKTTLKILYGSHDELNAGLRENRTDFVFSFDAGADSGHPIRATKLFEQRLVLVAGKRHQRRRFNESALRETPVIDYYQSTPLIERWVAHHWRRRPKRIPVAVFAATTNLVLDLVLQQAGVAVLPEPVVAPYVRRKRLAVVRTGRPELVDPLWLKELEGAYRGPGLVAFREAALREFAPS